MAEKQDGGTPEKDVDKGDAGFGSKFKKGLGWGNIGAGILSAMTDINIAKSNKRLSDISGRIADQELELAKTQEMTSARDAAKVRRKRLDEVMSARIMQNAMSGLKSEGTALNLSADAEVASEDEVAAMANLRARGRVMDKQVRGRKRVSEHEAETGVSQARSQGVRSLISAFRSAPL
jgi:hypothetical protein